MRLFLDTNAVIDLFSNEDGARQLAMREIVSLCRGTGSSFIVAATTIKDVSYLIEDGAWFKLIVPSSRRRRELAVAARDFMLRRCEVRAVDHTICYKAHLNLDEPDFDDAVIAECAAHADADAIISSDTKTFGKSAVKRVSPQECVALLCESR